MNDLLNKFDNIQIENDNRLESDDKEYCDKQYELYVSAHTTYTEAYKIIKAAYLSKNGYISDYGKCGIHEIENAIVGTTSRFISHIVYYFEKWYGVDLEYTDKYDGFNHYHDDISKLNALTLNEVLDTYIFSALSGHTFKEKAITEIKAKALIPQKYNSWYKKWNYDIKGKIIKFTFNIDSIKPALYFYDNNETDIVNYYTHNKIDDFTSYENGNTNIKFYKAEYALDFAKRYLGYVEITQEQRQEIMQKS